MYVCGVVCMCVGLCVLCMREACEWGCVYVCGVVCIVYERGMCVELCVLYLHLQKVAVLGRVVFLSVTLETNGFVLKRLQNQPLLLWNSTRQHCQ